MTETSFEMAPISVLVGPNNTGKSSLIKSLFVLKQYFDEVNLDHKNTSTSFILPTSFEIPRKSEYYVGKTEDFLSHGSDSDQLHFELPALLSEILGVKNAALSMTFKRIDSYKMGLIEFLLKTERNKIIISIKKIENEDYEILINYNLIEKFANKKSIVEDKIRTAFENVKGETPLQKLITLDLAMAKAFPDARRFRSFNSSLDDFYEIDAPSFLEKKLFLTPLDKKQMKFSYSGSDIQYHSEKICDEEKKFFKEISETKITYSSNGHLFIDIGYLLLNLFNQSIDKKYNNIKAVSSSFLINFASIISGTVDHVMDTYKRFFRDHSFHLSVSRYIYEPYISKDKNPMIYGIIEDYRKRTKNVKDEEDSNYLRSQVFSNLMLFPLEFKNYHELLKQYEENLETFKLTMFFYEKLDLCVFFRSEDFLIFWLNKLKIADDIRFEPLENNAFKVLLQKNGHEISLFNSGFGIIQIVSLFLMIAQSSILGHLSDFMDPNLIILEEPEANLHPKFQSQLADILISAATNFRIQFIIETHSEYFIRKLQYLTAKSVIDEKHVGIFYFSSDKEKPMKISIKSDGSLSQDFGPGFFDEADNLAIDLFNINKINKN